MATQVEVTYPSTGAFSGTGQLDLGPFFVPDVQTLLRAEVRGNVNFQGVGIGPSSVYANFQLWAVQWAPHGSAPSDIVTTADGPFNGFLIREQLYWQALSLGWTPDTSSAASLQSAVVRGEWAGQLALGFDIDLWLSFNPPTGAGIANQNVFASLRFWWS